MSKTAIVKTEIVQGELLTGGAVLQHVEQVLQEIQKGERSLEQGYVTLGKLLVDVSKNEYWRAGDYPSWGAYITHLAEQYGKGRTQLYSYFSTAKVLLPYISEEQLEQMGISKGYEIKKAVKATELPPSPEIIEAAVKPETTVQQVRELLFADKSLVPNEKGLWVDFGGSYLTPEEKATLDESRDAAMRTDPVVQPDIPKHVQTKEWLLRMAMNFLADHE